MRDTSLRAKIQPVRVRGEDLGSLIDDRDLCATYRSGRWNSRRSIGPGKRRLSSESGNRSSTALAFGVLPLSPRARPHDPRVKKKERNFTTSPIRANSRAQLDAVLILPSYQIDFHLALGIQSPRDARDAFEYALARFLQPSFPLSRTRMHPRESTPWSRNLRHASGRLALFVPGATIPI